MSHVEHISHEGDTTCQFEKPNIRKSNNIPCFQGQACKVDWKQIIWTILGLSGRSKTPFGITKHTFTFLPYIGSQRKRI